MATILLQNQPFEYQVNRKGIRSIRLRLISKNSLQISCPYLTPDFLIQKFIKNNTDWIINHSVKISPKKSILSLKTIKILDNSYEIIWIKTQRDSVIIQDVEQKIYSNMARFNESHVKKVLEAKLRPFALKLIKKELDNLSKKFNFKYGKVTVRNQSSRYGSCSGHGNLSFNWQIIFFPYSQFCHILLHELTHLDIKNHSKRFWSQLTIYDPDCKQHNLWLKQQGTKHLIF
ncbi:MAG TPA: SprT family zinc-dependent metalloprotease [Candidatus Woesebacteria bacterium]|nr:SprT family zinc-dependent metalloprotease [Candidatus Woesebacteria bacterium]